MAGAELSMVTKTPRSPTLSGEEDRVQNQGTSKTIKRLITIILTASALTLTPGCATMNSTMKKSWDGATKGKTSRVLDGRERWLAAQIFGATFRPALMRLVYDSLVSVGAPKTIKNQIHFPKDKNVGDRRYATSEAYAILFAHEATHVWQFQNIGLLYIADALFHQGKGYVEHGDRNVAYRYNLDPNKRFKTYNSEQQGKIIEEYVALKAYGRPATSCDNCAALGDAGFLSTIEAMIKRDINQAFVALDRATVQGVWSGKTPPR